MSPNTVTEEEIKEEKRQYYRDYYRENRKQIRENQKKWRAENPDKVAAKNARYWQNRVARKHQQVEISN